MISAPKNSYLNYGQLLMSNGCKIVPDMMRGSQMHQTYHMELLHPPLVMQVPEKVAIVPDEL
jgi:hypothetical protein